jgi:hypothetical protein
VVADPPSREAKELYWRPGATAAKAIAFWEDTLRYLYLPRLKDDTLLLIELEAAKAFEEASRPKPKPEPEQEKPIVPPVPVKDLPLQDGEKPRQEQPETQSKPRSFHGTADISPATAKMRMIELAEEIVSLLMTDPNAHVKVSR